MLKSVLIFGLILTANYLKFIEPTVIDLLRYIFLIWVILIMSNSGNMIIFHDKLIHGGAENKGKNTIISLEFTMLMDR